jgi:hypothetical protein
MFQRLGWCKFIVVVVICAPIACSEQLLPQLVAQIASLDGDHGVSLHANDDCVDLILTHKDHASPKNDEGPGLMLSVSEAAHVVHIATGSTTPKQSPLLVVSNTPDVVPFFSTTVVSAWRTFVPPPRIAYSRPPPDETSNCPLDSSVLLLI